ncbi:MAG: nickel pincer cofactor biosynthesis protein LarB [Planctomycetaceae bacterium]
MDPNAELTRLWQQCLADGASPQTLLEQLLPFANAQDDLTANTGATRLDLDRQRRCGHPEVIFAQGKTIDGLLEIIDRQSAAGQAVLATRVSPEQGRAVLAACPDAEWNEVARTIRRMPAEPPVGDRGHVVVVTAGTSDRPVAEEALETLRWMRAGRSLLTDVGVAGPWRLLEQLPRLKSADAVIVAAGMEGALPSVVGGWVPCPVIAVPTSIGYGAAFQGLTALLGMLNSCAANVTVVNIDAGFKAGYIAGLIATAAARGTTTRPASPQQPN